ncbi:MAG: pimeloyl-CoA dehydrogenase large subunit [Alphaproteobacteria bacterium]|nr:MAG: pimeloyl-CoA dehydrogenase large subunit [Alphaproteobacteria bacterium]
MELQLNADDAAFRDEVRDFIRENLAPELKRKVEMGQELGKEDIVRWHKTLLNKGWAAPNWPAAFGGPGWSPMQKHIFDGELAAGSAPQPMPFGLSMIGPLIITFGTDEQKKRYLPRIVSGEDWWCQGYSEPGAGSDLASLQTKAVRDGDHYIVNGTKTWTTLAQFANMMFCLVRTSNEGKRQAGISFLLMDMTAPGITVRPIQTIDGGREINEVFLDDVRVPVENLIGEENKGWTYAKVLLAYERTGIAAIGRSRKLLRKVREIAASEPMGEGTVNDDPDFRRKIAEVEVDLLALESVVLKVLAAESTDKGPGPEASVLKIKATEIQQSISELLFEAIGNYAHPYVPEALEAGWNEDPIGPDYAAALAPQYFNWRKRSIYGGTNEIQKNIIAKIVLGL